MRLTQQQLAFRFRGTVFRHVLLLSQPLRPLKPAGLRDIGHLGLRLPVHIIRAGKPRARRGGEDQLADSSQAISGLEAAEISSVSSDVRPKPSEKHRKSRVFSRFRPSPCFLQASKTFRVPSTFTF